MIATAAIETLAPAMKTGASVELAVPSLYLTGTVDALNTTHVTLRFGDPPGYTLVKAYADIDEIRVLGIVTRAEDIDV